MKRAAQRTFEGGKESRERSSAEGRSVLRVQFPAGTQFKQYTDYQRHYLTPDGWPIPNREVWVGDERWVTINSLGCKGPEVEADARIIGFFGDSTTFGIGAADGWPFHVRIPGYSVLNAGVEGHALDRLCVRYERLRGAVNFAAVVIGGSWHNLVYNERGEQTWGAFFARFADAPLLAICTLPTALLPASCERGLDDLVQGRAGRKAFHGWGSWPTAPYDTRLVYDAVLRYNQFVRRYCLRTGATLIDLFSTYRPGSYDDSPDMFTDPLHARPELYPALGQRVSDALGRRLPVIESAAPAPVNEEPRSDAVPSDYQLSDKVYPLW